MLIRSITDLHKLSESQLRRLIIELVDNTEESNDELRLSIMKDILESYDIRA